MYEKIQQSTKDYETVTNVMGRSSSISHYVTTSFLAQSLSNGGQHQSMSINQSQWRNVKNHDKNAASK